mmetsp:Transcript_102279/g.176619  ORF Transcript_102279/g.176619 Transcript_102279/m.176619 type:complete len:239 (-) Transcript_102279:1088-1804(-)
MSWYSAPFGLHCSPPSYGLPPHSDAQPPCSGWPPEPPAHAACLLPCALMPSVWCTAAPAGSPHSPWPPRHQRAWLHAFQTPEPDLQVPSSHPQSPCWIPVAPLPQPDMTPAGNQDKHGLPPFHVAGFPAPSHTRVTACVPPSVKQPAAIGQLAALCSLDSAHWQLRASEPALGDPRSQHLLTASCGTSPRHHALRLAPPSQDSQDRPAVHTLAARSAATVHQAQPCPLPVHGTVHQQH